MESAPGAKPPSLILQRLGWVSAFLVVVMLVTAGFSLWRGSERRSTGNLPVLHEVPAFQLVDQDGKPFGRDDLRGRIWIADFFFTTCKGPCPMLTARMVELQKALQKTPAVRLVSISVDPENDTPPVLQEYARRNQADPTRWTFLTGEAATVNRLVRQGFRQPLEEGGTEGPVHGTQFILVDGRGMVRGIYALDDPEMMQKILLDTGTLLREQSAAAAGAAAGRD